MKQVHIINQPLVGGAELVSARLATRFSNGKLYYMIGNREQVESFQNKNKVVLSGFFSILHKLIKGGNKLFLHNLQSQVVLLILCKFLDLWGIKNYPHIVIHYDADHVKKRWLKLLVTILKKSDTVMVFVSPYTLKKFKKYIKIKNEKTHIIYNGVHERFFNHYRKENVLLKPIKHKLRVGFIGRNAPVKRLSLFLEICEKMRAKTNLDIFVVIQSNLKNSDIKESNQELFHLVNCLNFKLIDSKNDPQEFYEECDVVVSTSLTETFSLIAIESLATKTRFYSYGLECLDDMFDKPHFNLKAKSIDEFVDLFAKDLARPYPIPNLENFKESKMLEQYAYF